MTENLKKPTGENSEYLDIVLTSVRLHVNKPRKPMLIARSIEKTIRTGKPCKFFGERRPAFQKNGKPQSLFKVSSLAPLQELARKTGKQIRIHLPVGGIPVYLAKDTLEVAEKKKRKLQKH